MDVAVQQTQELNFKITCSSYVISLKFIEMSEDTVENGYSLPRESFEK